MIHWKLPVMHTHTQHIENGKNYMAESALNRMYIVHIQFTTRISKSQPMCAFLICPRLLSQNAHILTLTCRVFRWIVLSRFFFVPFALLFVALFWSDIVHHQQQRINNNNNNNKFSHHITCRFAFNAPLIMVLSLSLPLYLPLSRVFTTRGHKV